VNCCFSHSELNCRWCFVLHSGCCEREAFAESGTISRLSPTVKRLQSVGSLFDVWTLLLPVSAVGYFDATLFTMAVWRSIHSWFMQWNTKEHMLFCGWDIKPFELNFSPYLAGWHTFSAIFRLAEFFPVDFRPVSFIGEFGQIWWLRVSPSRTSQ